MRKIGPWELNEILKAVQARLEGKCIERFVAITDDTRVLQPGDLFIALRGQRHDGHDFILQALEKGGKGFIVNRMPFLDKDYSKYSWLIVSDTLLALGRMAQFYRKRFKNIPLIGITGSCGKTTTKEAIYSVLSQRFTVLKTEGNLNNQIGLPFTILGIRPEHDLICVEIGTNKVGEIDYLSSIAMPQIAVITSIKPAHLKGLDSLETIAKEKAAILKYTEKCFVYNTDDVYLSALAAEYPKEKVGFGWYSGHVYVNEVRRQGVRLVLNIRTPWGELLIPTNLIGKHQVYALLAAAAVGWYLGVSKDEIIQALSSFRPLSGRFAYFRDKKGRFILDDTYNANPGSMEAALKALAEQEGAKIAVLGDMLELGDKAVFWHEKIGKLAGGMGLKALVLYGRYASCYANGALRAGMPQKRIFVFETKEDIASFLEENAVSGDNILLKASNSVGFREVVERLKENL